MNIVNSGNRFQVYGEEVMTYRKLPVASYDVAFSKMSGFFLTSRSDLTVTEPKVYGGNAYRVEKVMKSYGLSNRNFGVLLSGQKGIGKSLFIRMLAQRAITEELPVIIVADAIPGIAGFIASIQQDCVVVFDEFEKTFAQHDDYKPQDDMLSLFDGIDGGHKLFVVTCNDINQLSPYMLNRPGRFHYHFTIGAPDQDEVREYLKDNVEPEYAGAIEDVVNLSCLVDMPYDYLRAIAFELNQGYPLREVMSDLNITRASVMRFDVDAYSRKGTLYHAWNENINMLEPTSYKYMTLRNTDTNMSFNIQFYPGEARIESGHYVIDKRIEMPVFEEDDFMNLPADQRTDAADAMNADPIVRLVLTKCPAREVARLLV